MEWKLFLQLIINGDQGLFIFSLPLTKSCSCMCKSVFFFFCVLVWDDQALPQYSPCVLWARGAWLSSCHTVAHGTCPVIWTDLLNLSADSQTVLQPIFSGECLHWSLSNKHPGLTFRGSINCLESKYLFYTVTYLKKIFACIYGWFSWPAFLASLNPHQEGSGEMHSFASLATDVGERIFFVGWTFWRV